MIRKWTRQHFKDVKTKLFLNLYYKTLFLNYLLRTLINFKYVISLPSQKKICNFTFSNLMTYFIYSQYYNETHNLNINLLISIIILK